MDRRTRENLVYVGEKLTSRFGKPILYIFLILMVGGGIVWGFQKVDVYLTPSYAQEEEQVEEIIEVHIAIPKIGLSAPVTFVDSTDPDAFLEPLKKGVVHYPSALPGNKGASIMLGHSAPPGWFGNLYDGVFSNLKDLEEGDLVVLSTEAKTYTYKVSAKFFLDRGQDIPESIMQSDVPRLLLLSCWPPGINNKRIMIQAEAI
jgi:LPXTG-site transpeptidase (sortase) family protein